MWQKTIEYGWEILLIQVFVMIVMNLKDKSEKDILRDEFDAVVDRAEEARFLAEDVLEIR